MRPLDKVHESWYPILGSFYHSKGLNTLRQEILPNISYQPQRENIFNVFSMPLDRIKVVILGQDPYPTPGDATGYCFATVPTRKTPRSLQIIAKEIEQEGLKTGFYDSDIPHWQTLEHWTEQGVFLLNTALTVKTGTAGSHLKYWLDFTNGIIRYISEMRPCIWVLWGKKAQSFIPQIRRRPFNVKGYHLDTIVDIPKDDYNYILQAPHPAAELYNNGNAGFYGCNHFMFINKILGDKNKIIF